VVDFRSIEPAWLREIVKDWARATRPHLQRLRETLRSCQAASHTLIAAGRVDPATLGSGDFTRIIDAISGQRRVDGTLYSAQHRNLLLYQFCQVPGGIDRDLWTCFGRDRSRRRPNAGENP
jgi:hypothetical protein